MERNKIIAWDLGTSGNKASLYDADGVCIADASVSYDTIYNAQGWHEQRPSDWWQAVVKSTRMLLEKAGIQKEEILSCGISGHSLGSVLVDKEGNLLGEQFPIWSDARAGQESAECFEKFAKNNWYMLTGNGVNPGQYPVFKACWYRKNRPDIFARIHKIIGTKDYINYRLTGILATDHSYASGSGAYDLLNHDYSDEILEANGLNRTYFPDILQSTDVVGKITAAAAEEIGLDTETLVTAGGVDNVCMAIGARGFAEGRAYISLGTSCWIALTSAKPVLDTVSYPYVFALREQYYNSALCIGSGGSSYKWVRDMMCSDLVQQYGGQVFEQMAKMAGESPVGAHGLMFNPCLSGGMPFDKSANISGGFLGMRLGHTKGDILRATLEGITFNLRQCKERIERLAPIDQEILLVGGGSKNALWRQILADCLGKTTLKSNVDDQAAALGAAAIAAVGTGLWSDYDRIDSLHEIEVRCEPDAERTKQYDELFGLYEKAADFLCDYGDYVKNLNIYK